MSTTSPTRIDDELFASAQLVGPLMSRSASQQITHWARIGRELEAAGSVSQRAIADVLAARQDYDQLTAEEQAVVRAEWAERIDARREALDLAQEFSDQGRSYVELDDDGEIVRRGPSER
ncbi:MAG: TA system antitoxin ParD family protein [Acidimicrobiales bacterium]